MAPGKKDKGNAQKEEIEYWADRLQNSNKVADHQEAIGHALSALSIGRDVGSIYGLVTRFGASRDLKLKKLTYLFVLAYHQAYPEAQNGFVKTLEVDSQDKEHAVVRAQAIRAMGSLCTRETVQGFSECIRRGLTDSDPFVRKTAVIAVARVYTVSPEVAIQRNLVHQVKEALSDGNQAVVSAAASTLTGIAARLSPEELYGMFGAQSAEYLFSWQEVQALLTALGTSTEWSALHILSAIANYGQLPVNYEEADATIQRLTNFLRHSNPAVGLTAVNLIIKYVYADPPILNTEQCYKVQGMCVAPLVSFIGSSMSAEARWIALRCLRLVASAFVTQDQQNPFSRQVRLLFAKYNDPLYIKLEKIEILAVLADDINGQEVIVELTEYVRDVDPLFVRAAIRALGVVAIRVPSVADFAVHSFLKLITGSGDGEVADEAQHFKLPDYAAQELMVATQLIFRRYPERYEGIIGTLCENIVTLDDPDAKAALIWILGEYANRIDGSEDVIADLVGLTPVLYATEDSYDPSFSGTLLDEAPGVQLQFLTSCTKLFLYVPTIETQRLLQHTLQLVTERAESPDVRQRSSFYWRLLSVDPTLGAAKSVVLAQKAQPQITDGMPDAIRAALIRELGSVSCVLRELITDTAYSGPDIEEALQILDTVGTSIQQYSYDEIVGSQRSALSTAMPPSLPPSTTVSAPVADVPNLPKAVVRDVQPTALPAFGTATSELLQPAAQKTNVVPAGSNVSQDVIAGLIGNVTVTTVPHEAPMALQLPKADPVPAPPPVAPVAPVPAPVPTSTPAPAPAPVVVPEPAVATLTPSAVAPPATVMPPVLNALPYFDPQYPFATVQNAPTRQAAPQNIMDVSLSWTRADLKPLMLLTIKNKGTVPFSDLMIGFASNGLGLSPVDPHISGAVVGPGEISNGGQPLLIPVQFRQDPNTQFTKERLSQPDPQCTGNLTLLTFAIKGTGIEGVCQFQCKIPIHVLASETSAMHDANRNLINPPQAVQQFYHNWGLVQDSLAHKDITTMTFAQLGVADISGVAEAVIAKARRANFNLVDRQDGNIALIMSIPLAAYPQNLPTLIRIAWRPTANGAGVDFCTLLKIPPIGVMCISYVMQSLKFALLK
ncbi:Beta adaptin [Giardia muris]|uniref:Beta adaptin n=1 Tax=Giardia muris TaxID=5742 RepID=A0A4Z1SLC8_GIAMU|nr:Beta adaptin [Giardia muris]|eukprot:TNJ26444.1 Beta adaptin [Giardia muris]